ncbi:MAG: retropepsin-like domain-containing protein, partial [Planctomycetales bacterium]
CSHPAVRTAGVARKSAQTRLTQDSLTKHQRIESVNAANEQLQNDTHVQNALTALGKPHRLGKAKLSASDQQRLARGEKIAIPNAIPMYCSAGQYRVAATVGLATPATMTFQPGSGPGYLPHSLIRKAGITIPDSAPKQQFRTEDGRILSVRVIQIDYLRLGSQIIEDVVFYALPPEGEDLGGRFTDETLKPYKVKVDPAHLRLIIRAGSTS